MSLIKRAFIQLSCVGKGVCDLDPEEAHHVIHVLRGRVGDKLELLDGVGGCYAGEITQIEKKTCRVAIIEKLPMNPPDKVSLILGVSMPDKKRAATMTRMLAEIGVHRLFHIASDRSEWDNDAIRKFNKRLTSISRESCKQSGRSIPMDIGDPKVFDALCAEVSYRPGIFALIASTKETVKTISDRLAVRRSENENADNRVLAIIGPVGDFTDTEYGQACDAGFLPVTLGQRTLRVETAAVAVAAQIFG